MVENISGTDFYAGSIGVTRGRTFLEMIASLIVKELPAGEVDEYIA